MMGFKTMAWNRVAYVQTNPDAGRICLQYIRACLRYGTLVRQFTAGLLPPLIRFNQKCGHAKSTGIQE